ncbi:NAD-dependent epimerase/dehydratase family protein [Hallerella succinigenes]|uniref:NAD-dependent epimerase/dehydratase family protein n=1 Tax=Hallerella succinigenes TaxID=1896222 RepID=UPI002A7F615F|nr:NAD-dependent epimerase/dehydratase family protein [Hallerella succinigenes]MDY5030162.1 NAD-dependent epimerase/dehydratase family protein [Hallerella succinigenes]
MDCTIALVGAGGFVGSHLLRALLERTPWKILAVDLDFHRLQNLRSQKDSRVEFLLADIAEPQIIQMVSQCEIVVNLAAICTPSRYMSEALAVIESNFSHPAALADACAKTGSWLVYFSTSEVYGKTTLATEVLDEDASDFIQGSVKASRWSYAVAKQLSERYIAAIPNLKYSVVRPFNFIGPWMDFMPGVDGDGIPRVLANFSSALVQNEPMVLVNGGEARRSFTSIHDAVDFMFCLFENREKAYGEAFNVGNAKNELSIRELAVLMRRIYARILSVPEEKLSPFKELSGEAYYGEGYEDSLRRIPSVKKSKCLLGFEAKIPLEEALEESLRWFHAHYTSECKRS